MNSKKADILLIFAAFVGGAGFIGMKYLLEAGYNTFQTIYGRFFVASVFMAIVFKNNLKGITKNDIKGGFITGVFLFGLFFFMVVGLKYTTASVNAFLTNVSSVIVPFICWIFFNNKPKFYSFLAGFVTVLGVWFLSFDGNFDFGFGAFMSLIASFSFAFQIVFIERFVKNTNTVNLAIIENLTVFILAFLVSFIMGEKLPTLKKESISVFLMLGIFCTGMYFVIQSVCQKYTSSSKVGVILCSEAVFTAVMSAFIMNEKMSSFGILGCVFIFLGVIIAETKFSFILNIFKNKSVD